MIKIYYMLSDKTANLKETAMQPSKFGNSNKQYKQFFLKSSSNFFKW